MPDETTNAISPTAQVSDQLVSYQLLKVSIEPLARMINYTFQENWTIRGAVVHDGTVLQDAFDAARAAAATDQAFLVFLKSAGYEAGLHVE